MVRATLRCGNYSWEFLRLKGAGLITGLEMYTDRCLVFKIGETLWFQAAPVIFVFAPGPVPAHMEMKKATPYLLFS